MAATLQQIEAALQAALSPQSLNVQDDSHLHVGHAGHGSGHYTVHIVSEKFQGLSSIARHRLVYDALRDLMVDGIHALAIHASTPPAN
jgi:BolA protein